MMDYQRIFHTGLLVRDLGAAMDHYGRTLNLTWARPFTFEALPLWTPKTGLQHLRLEVTYSIEGPQHLEIQVGPKGSHYDPGLHSGFHVGCWVDDVRAEVTAMQREGWQVVAAGATPEDGWGTFVYLEPPGGGLTVEIVSIELQPMLQRWWAGAESLA
jgi:predicted enzyme related to lactoylglutathione lyase